MSNDSLHCLRALGDAADVPAFLHLAKPCATVVRLKPDSNAFRRVLRQGYSALMLAALSKGLQLYNTQKDSPPGVAQELQQLGEWLNALALAVNNLFRSMRLGVNSPEAIILEQEVFDSGVLPLMQQSWRQLAADMEQHKQRTAAGSSPKPGSSTEPSAAQAGMPLTRLVTLTDLLLQLWIGCSCDGDDDGPADASPQPPSKLVAAVSTIPYLADMATGIAAIWRSQGVLKQGHAAAASSSAPPGPEAAAAAAAAHRPQRSSRQEAEAEKVDQLAILTTVLAAIRLSCFLTFTMNRQRQMLPGTGAAHDLQWVMLVHTALLVGRLHHQQDGMSPVQLHTQLTDTTASSSNQQRPTSSRSAGSSNRGSTKKGSSKKGSRTQQASSSSSSITAASSMSRKQQHSSVVHPYHLQVLEAAGVAPARFDLHTEHLTFIVDADALPTNFFTLHVVLKELEKQLTGQTPNSAAAAAAAAAAGLNTRSTTTSSNSTGLTHGSSTTDGSTQGSSAGGAAAVLALLAPCSLMWGEFHALYTDPAAAKAAVLPVETMVSGLWYTSLAIDTAASKQQEAMQQEPVGLPFDTVFRRTINHGVQSLLGADSWYRSCVELIVPSLLYMRAVGTVDAGRYSLAAEEWFRRLDHVVMTRLNARGVWEMPFAEPSQGTPPALPIFSNPAVCITSLEAAVRHDWDASTVPGQDSTGLKLTAAVLLALSLEFLSEMPQPSSSSSSSAMLQYATDSSKSPALLSLLLSCLKQLQHSCQHNPQGALRTVAKSGTIADIAMHFFQLCTQSVLPARGATVPAVDHASSTDEASAASSSSSSSVTSLPASRVRTAATSSSSSATPRDGSSTRPPGAEPPAVEAAPSTACAQGPGKQPHATEGPGALPSTWLVLFGRAMYTAGAAMQTVAAGATPNTETRSKFRIGSIPVSAPATCLLRSFHKYTTLVCVYMQADTAATAISRRSLGRVQPAAAAVDPVLQAYHSLAGALAAAAQHAEELEQAAETSSSTGGIPAEWLSRATGGRQAGGLEVPAMRQSASSSMGIWRQVLGSEQGRQLPQALMDVGSLLCTALPSRSCCNEPSCCCLDKSTELQLAGGKGTKCSACGVARYCSPAHQKKHWKQHKPACRAIAAAAAAAAAAAEKASK